MYVVVQHHIKNPETAFPRGQRLISGEGAPEQVKVLQFLPSLDLTEVTAYGSPTLSTRSRGGSTPRSATRARTSVTRSPPIRRSPSDRWGCRPRPCSAPDSAGGIAA
jgi:hypothetical protein